MTLTRKASQAGGGDAGGDHYAVVGVRFRAKNTA